jgi:hypothetical protein
MEVEELSAVPNNYSEQPRRPHPVSPAHSASYNVQCILDNPCNPHLIVMFPLCIPAGVIHACASSMQPTFPWLHVQGKAFFFFRATVLQTLVVNDHMPSVED